MELKRILTGIENFKAKGDLDIDIVKVVDDSRKVVEGCLFVAVKGFEFDGHSFVNDAIAAGARAVIVDIRADLKQIKIPAGVTAIVVEDSRKALAIVACNFYDNPSRKFKLIGITGTKGKTTTTFMIKSILEKAGKKVGLIGTVANYIGDECLGFSQRTTPGSLELQELFAKMATANMDVVVMEVSSQSLKYHRVDGSYFDIAVFTNFFKDHISAKEHPDVDDYFGSKMRLFSMCNQGFINVDDFKSSKVINTAKNCEFKTFGIDNSADILAKDITITNVSVDYKVKIENRNERIKVNIPGRFSVYNSMAAISVALKFGATVEMIKESLEMITVPGRSELVANDKELAVMIDYAHTPESLSGILQAVKSYTKGRVISVFGCGGERDKEKRVLMGEVSGRIADFTIITSDNPRRENPKEIVAQIEEGIKKTKGKYKVVENRKEAIKEAIKMINKRDIIVLAGKGHETYQEINGEKNPFDERIIVKEFISEKK